MDPAQERMHLHRSIIFAITLQLSLLLPTLLHLILHYHMKEPYHTSILSGYAWLQELLHGHPEHICMELGVHRDVFHAPIGKLRSMGHGDTRYVMLEEQLAIFLYTSVTGLSTHHVGEWFQHANGTISKWVLWSLAMTIYIPIWLQILSKNDHHLVSTLLWPICLTFNPWWSCLRQDLRQWKTMAFLPRIPWSHWQYPYAPLSTHCSPKSLPELKRLSLTELSLHI